jgi:DNA-directed RNA polymerase subunit RPC12/RpoP
VSNPPVSSSASKPCRVCGVDLAGRSRLKDELGYLCKPCADQLDAAEKGDPDALSCPECGRRLKRAGFVEYRGALICRSCKAHRDEIDRYKPAKIDATPHKEEEKKSIVRLLILLGVCVFFILIGLIWGW